MKRLLIITLLLSAFMCLPAVAEVYYKCVESSVNINYMNQGSKAYNIIYCNSRLYVPFEQACKDFGITIRAATNGYRLVKDDKEYYVPAFTGTSNKTDMYYYNGQNYIYLYDLVEPFEDIPVVDTDSNTVSIYNSVLKDCNTYKALEASPKSAYIRLEDIMADGLDTSVEPKYDTNMLEELRYTAEYLYKCSQSYYIAWIPVYANPAANYWNDVSQTYNLYNSYFVYTLDYMVAHNGHLGLHGYTHQYGSNISAIGYEWGCSTPFSETEQEERLKKAVYCAQRLGFNAEFFEFPHYGATESQLKMASKYFDILYQPYPKAELSNYFTYSEATGKRVYYMPTPADYLHTKYDLSNMLERISSCISNNYTLSMFYHPVIDKTYIHEDTVDNDRVWEYEDGALPTILRYISTQGYVFSPML